jgi:tetratricopeptide (TPR) repeat protein
VSLSVPLVPSPCYNAGVIREWRVIILLCLICGGCGVRAEDPAALSRGIALVGAGDYPAAWQTLEPLLEETPGDSVLHYWLGRTYFGLRFYTKAVDHLDLAASRDLGNRDAWCWLARALRQAGAFVDAAAVYATCLQRFPEDRRLLGEYAAVRALAGDISGARESFERLRARDPDLYGRSAAAEWERALAGLTSRRQLEPARQERTSHFALLYEPTEQARSQVREEVERARAAISLALGRPVTGFRVLLFASWASYSRYARLLLPEARAVHATAFALPGELVILSPTAWATPNAQELTQTLRHEMVHLAVAMQQRGEGVPIWFNEGLACYFGETAGTRTGELPERPLAIPALEQAFLSGDRARQEAAYAQAYAMVGVLVRAHGTPRLLALLDRLAAAVPFPIAFEETTGESLARFAGAWRARVSPAPE